MDTGGPLQLGGGMELNAGERRIWADGDNDQVGSSLSNTVLLATPLTFMGGASDPIIHIGNGITYGSGTWTAR